MKKYWKLIFLTVFILVSLVIFYINTNTVSKSFTQFKFTKIEGDEKAVEDLVVNGDFFSGMYNIESFRVDNNGTTYLRDEPFEKRIKGYYQDIYIERLQKEHRSFMRGKHGDPDSFFENDELLAYGATPYNLWTYDNYEFDIAVLDKQTNSTNSFSFPIPKRGKYWYVEPYAVYVKGRELSIVTLNEKSMEDTIDTGSVHVYTFDIDKEQLIQEEVIDSIDMSTSENGYSDIRMLMDEHIMIVVGSQVTYKEPEDPSDDFGETVTVNTLVKYNLETGEKEEIPLPEKEDYGIPIAFNGEIIHFVTTIGKQLTLTNYNVEKKEITGELTVDAMNALYTYDIHQAKMKNGKLYFVPSPEESDVIIPIHVFDLESLTVDYYGKVEPSDPPENNTLMEMYINYVELKND